MIVVGGGGWGLGFDYGGGIGLGETKKETEMSISKADLVIEGRDLCKATLAEMKET